MITVYSMYVLISLLLRRENCLLLLNLDYVAKHNSHIVCHEMTVRVKRFLVVPAHLHVKGK